MSLDPKFVIAPSLEMYFVNKDDGLPLAFGKVYFFHNDQRNIPKDIFTLSGFPDYGYTALTNPVVLSAVGTFQDDDGNNVLPYYYPYDVNGNIDLYYIEVYDENDILQFTREAWPNVFAGNVDVNQDITNYVPNGQFLLRNNVPASSDNNFTAGLISEAVTEIAQGGWTFNVPDPSDSTNFVTFFRYAAWEQEPTGNPRYALQVQCTVSGTDTFKDLRLKFPNVNTFSSGSLKYNLYFECKSTGGSDITNCQVRILKHFGAGGSVDDNMVVGTFSMTNETTAINTPISFGTNEGFTIGTGDDDYVSIVIRFPANATFTAQLTDFALIVNEDPLLAFPQQTEAQQLAPSTAGWLPVPNPDGSDLYLPTILTKSGMTFDHSVVGKIVASMERNATSPTNELLCDGAAYRTADYSDIGIPYSRLWAKIWSAGRLLPIHGTGPTFMTAYSNPNLLSQIILVTNAAGLQTNPANGGLSAGFSFGTVVAGSPAIGYKGFSNTNAGHLMVYSTFSAVTNGNAGISQHTYTQPVTNVRNNAIAGIYKQYYLSSDSATNLSNSGGAGKYFTFSSNTTNYYVWFRCTTGGGAETDPAPGGTGIMINLQTANITSAAVNEVGIIIAAAFSAQQVNTITTVAASSITDGSYIIVYDGAGTAYNVWFSKGTASSPGGNAIKVTLTGSETANEVATAVITAINSYQFAVPNLQGIFLRGADPNSIWDFNVSNRVAPINLEDDLVGTLELDQLQRHNHTVVIDAYTAGVAGVNGSGNGVNQNGPITYTSSTYPGSSAGENIPVNKYVNYYIKY